MNTTRIVLGAFYTNCYLVEGDAEQALLIDPADDGDALVRLLEEQALTPAAVLLTHGHYDHFLAVPQLQARWPALPVYCHPLDVQEELTEVDMGQTFPTVAAFKNVLPLAEGQTLELAGLRIDVLHTPGHTPGSVTFRIGDALFTGDTLFAGSIGRTDFAGGDMRQMNASLARLAKLNGDLPVLPGHEGTTTLTQEKARNPYLAQFVQLD